MLLRAGTPLAQLILVFLSRAICLQSCPATLTYTRICLKDYQPSVFTSRVPPDDTRRPPTVNVPTNRFCFLLWLRQHSSGHSSDREFHVSVSQQLPSVSPLASSMFSSVFIGDQVAHAYIIACYTIVLKPTRFLGSTF